MHRALWAAVPAAAVLIGGVSTTAVKADGGTGSAVIYDSTVRPLPGNLDSLGPEAYAFNEIGDQVTFSGSARALDTVVVTMSSWGCETGHWNKKDCKTTPGAHFSLPITLDIYAVGPSNTVGARIAARTQVFNIPYRPSAGSRCTGTQAGEWFDGSQGCFNGLAHNITFNLRSQHVNLPNSVVYGVAYDTSTSGYHPHGPAACSTSSGGCAYDSLNVALTPKVVVGSKANPNTIYWDTRVAGFYCDFGTGGVGTFRLDSPTSACWTPPDAAVAARFVAHRPCDENSDDRGDRTCGNGGDGGDGGGDGGGND
jgi:hypothetical protein